MKLSIIIPCYNEQETIRRVVKAVLEVPLPDKEIIIVDDGSTDGTRGILEGRDVAGVDKVIFHASNRGKGAALRTGFEAASGEILVIQDADLEYNPSDLPRLLEPIEAGRADAVFGSRFLDRHSSPSISRTSLTANRFLTHLSNLFTGMSLTDMETCYKMFRREIVEPLDLVEKRFGIEPEITARVAGKGCRICEVGISYHPRTASQGKKISWRDGASAIRAIIKYNTWGRA